MKKLKQTNTGKFETSLLDSIVFQNQSFKVGRVFNDQSEDIALFSNMILPSFYVLFT